MNVLKKKFSMLNLSLLVINILTIVFIFIVDPYYSASIRNIINVIQVLIVALILAFIVWSNKKISNKVKYFDINTTFLLANYLILGFTMLDKSNFIMWFLYFWLNILIPLYFIVIVIYFVIIGTEKNIKNIILMMIKILFYTTVIIILLILPCLTCVPF